MSDHELTPRRVLKAEPEARPAILEGRWLSGESRAGWMALHPVSVLEGGAEALKEFPIWLGRHAEQFPAGAAIGFIAYELGRHFEPVELPLQSGLPEFSMAYYERLQAFPPESLESRAGVPPSESRGITTDFTEEGFRRAVARVQEYIAAGDVYQANLTQQFRVEFPQAAAAELYARLREGRAAYGAFLNMPGRAILSASPERFFRVSGRHILASPIKGTLARGATPSEDARRFSALRASEKDHAENVMIVDLLRNDLGRVCEYSSIRARLFVVEPMPHLYHLVSHVEGTLRPNAGLAEVLRALFPCGSITGAPKVRAMEILAELERRPRGVSMGAIGVVRGAPGSAECQAEFSVAIRTMTLTRNVATFNVGCGIVVDSNPQAEFEEMMLKARPLLEALGIPKEMERSARQEATVEV